MTGTDPAMEAEIERRLRQLTLAEKVGLLTGDTTWTTRAIPRIGLQQIVFADGPAGVQGPDPESSSTSLPAPTALAATWDLALAERAGAVFAQEARRKGVDVVLAPVLNLQRTPVGGRHFENFSEDPVLTAQVGAALISAVQTRGVGACAKHFVANDSETDRTTYVARVDMTTLREAYLLPFERAVDAGAWTVMAAYNQVDVGDGAASMTEHAALLGDVLKGEWQFDGVVVSDWAATRSTVASAVAGLDLVMPGPGGPWELLERAVDAGAVPESAIDDKVRRLLRLAARVGKLDGVLPSLPSRRQTGSLNGPSPTSPPAPVPTGGPDPAAFSRELSARAMVVLRRGSSMPLPLGDHAGLRPPRSIAVLGANALHPYVQGGGSAQVRAPHEVSPLDGMTQALLGTGTVVRSARGGRTLTRAPLLSVELTDDGRGVPGILEEALGSDGTVLREQTRESTDWTWTDGLPTGTDIVRLSTRALVAGRGRHVLELGAIGPHRVWIDGDLVDDVTHDPGVEAILDSSVNAPPGRPVPIEVGDEPRYVAVRAELHVVDAGGYGRLVSATLRHQPPEVGADQEIADAVRVAAACDLAIVVVGTNREVESEGWDRTDLRLPGRQDDLVRAVLAANPHTLVVVNAGAPVELPWLSEVPTVVWAWLPGQEFGHALADVLLGRVEPAGRLPWTLPAAHADSPVPHARPSEGVVHYTEGARVGYRSWSAHGVAPAAPFGHGLGWSDFEYLALDVSQHGAGLVARVTVCNVGPRSSREVVQVYVVGPRSAGRRLAGFAVVDVAAGRAATVSVELDPAALQYWHVDEQSLRTAAGEYHVQVGRSSGDLRLDDHVSVGGDRAGEELGIRSISR